MSRAPGYNVLQWAAADARTLVKLSIEVQNILDPMFYDTYFMDLNSFMFSKEHILSLILDLVI